MKSLGWDDFELDDHTLQLIIAILETDFMHNPSPWIVCGLDPKSLNEDYEKMHILMPNIKNIRSLQE